MQPLASDFLLPSRLLLVMLLHFAWQATAIAIAVGIGRTLIQVRHVQARYLISVLGLVAILLTPAITLCFYLTNPETLPQGDGFAG